MREPARPLRVVVDEHLIETCPPVPASPHSVGLILGARRRDRMPLDRGGYRGLVGLYPATRNEVRAVAAGKTVRRGPGVRGGVA